MNNKNNNLDWIWLERAGEANFTPFAFLYLKHGSNLTVLASSLFDQGGLLLILHLTLASKQNKSAIARYIRHRNEVESSGDL